MDRIWQKVFCVIQHTDVYGREQAQRAVRIGMYNYTKSFCKTDFFSHYSTSKIKAPRFFRIARNFRERWNPFSLIYETRKI